MNPQARGPRLRKELGLFDVYVISTGAMFSSGFFLLPGLAAAKSGPSVALAYLVSCVFIIPAMFSVAELATAMPRAGGAYYFLDRSMGPLMGTVGGLGTWMALILKSAFALVGMGAYLALYFDVAVEPLAVALTVLFALVNIVGAKESSALQRWLVSALLLILGAFLVQGLLSIGTLGPTRVAAARFSPFLPMGLGGFMATVGFVFVSYAGLTKVASVAEEIRRPDRNIPLGMMLSLATAAAVYSLGVFVIVALVPMEGLQQDLTPVATAAGAMAPGPWAGIAVLFVVVAAIAAFASTGNAGILSSSRYPLAMARDRLVPRWLGHLGRFRTPTRSIVLTSALMAACILLLDVEGIAKLASAFQLLLFSLLNLAVIIMRESGIHGYDPGYRSPLYPWMQVLGFLAPYWLIVEMGQAAILFTLGLVTVTVGWYFHYARPTVQREGAIFHTFARLGERRYAGLDLELRAIVREKGLRDEDPFDEVVARAGVIEQSEPITFVDLASAAAARLESRTRIPRETLVAGFTEGLHGGFTPVSEGVAIPHLRVPGVSRPVLLLARCGSGISPPNGLRAPQSEELRRVRAAFFLISPEDDPGQHLRLLGHLATIVDDPSFLPRWCEARDESELPEVLLQRERSLTLRVTSATHTGAWLGMPLKSVPLPKGTLVALVRRDGSGIVPDGSTTLQEGDSLTVIGSAAGIRELAEATGHH
jgi:amino acid transporter/mannitol/fructose-specific phosphotransferase system IIA component (Ntr-type)